MKNILYFFILLTAINRSFAQLTAPGDIAFVSMNADGTDGIAFLALVDIAPNTTIYFTDNEWQSSAFNTNESYFQWVHTSCVSAGTVVIIQNINQGTLSGTSANPTANIGTVIWSTTTAPNNNSGIANSDECVYAYLGTSYTTPTVFLAGIASSTSYGGVLTSTGLTLGSTFIQFTNNHDVFTYNSTNTCEATQAATLTKIATTSNWISQDGSGDQSNDGTAPDFPANVITSFTGCYTIGCVFPIQLTQFKAISQNKVNHIQWEFQNPELVKNVQLAVMASENNFETIYSKQYPEKDYYAHHIDSTGRYIYRLSWQDKNGVTYYSHSIEMHSTIDAQITLYPNPALDKIWVSSIQQGKSYHIYTVQGQKVAQGVYFSNIDISALKQGLYFLRFTDSELSYTLLFTKIE